MANIIFDGNYLFYKTLHVVKYSTRLNKNDVFLSENSHKESLIRKVAMDMAFAIRQFGSPDRIIFTLDDKWSWRKDVEILENDGYKSSRTKSDDISWTGFFEVMDEFAEILEACGIIISRIKHAEGDDLMYFWSDMLLSKGESSIIITGDRDMYQIVKSLKESYVVIFDNNSQRRSIHSDLGFGDWLDTPDQSDIFCMSNYKTTPKDLVINAIKNIKLEELDPKRFIIEKILEGDDGDDVPSIFYWPTKSGKKMNRVTKKRAFDLVEIVNSTIEGTLNIKNIVANYVEITNALKSITKIDDIDPEEIKIKLNRNIKLMYLSTKTIPGEIFSNFIIHAKENINKTLGNRSYSKDMFLEGTKYDNKDEQTGFMDNIFG